MRKRINWLHELNKGTWIRNLSMFLCVVLVVEGFWIFLGMDVVANQENSNVELYSDSEVMAERLLDNESSFSLLNVSENTPELFFKGKTIQKSNTLDEKNGEEKNVSYMDVTYDEYEYPEVRYDFCDIEYSHYANEQVDPQVFSSFYLSNTAESMERSSISAEDIEYDPYVSSPSSITPVRNQKSTDTCWAFATTGAAEIAAIRQGLSTSSQWYSPYHLAYFLYHRVTDPLGGTEGDTNIAVTNKSPDFLKGGGNIFMSLFYLSGWGGLTKDEKAPFDTYMSQGISLDNELAYDADLLLKNGYMLSTGANRIQDIKQAIVEYGAVAIQLQVGGQYENTTTGAYYCNKKGSNHAVVIVGWNDTYSRENFNVNCQPSSDGAWIVKNSYGTSLGRDGYNYLSYEDQSISYPIAMELMEANTYDNNYHYDGSLAVTDISVVEVESGGQVANVFTAHASAEGYDENLEAVSIALKSTDVKYKISIYKNLEFDETGAVNPSSGKLMLTQEGKTGRAGIYTIPLKQSVCLTSEDTFSVVFTLESEDGGNIMTWMERDFDYGWVKGSANIQKNQSFRRLTSRHTWFDLYFTNSTKKVRGLARIKAFTNTLSTISSNDISDYNITVSMNSFVADGSEKCPDVSILRGTRVLTQGTEYEVEYHNNIEPGEGQIVIKGIGPYTGTVTRPIYLYEYSIEQCPAHNFNDTKCVLCGYPLKEQKLNGTQSYTKEYLDDAFLLEVSGNTTDLSYSSDHEEVVVVDENGLVTIKGTGTANIIVTAEKSNEYQADQLEIQIQVQKAQIGEVRLLEDEFYYNGIPHEPSVQVKNKSGQVLTQGKDYTVQYSNHNEIGTATALVTGMGNYEGIKKLYFTILQLPEELCSHTYLNGNCKYCGYERKMQQISGTFMYEKIYSEKGFWLDAKTNGDGVLTYLSDDPSVVTVDEKGYVTIQGTGIAYIYVKAKETSLYYGATKEILVEILPGKSEIFVMDSNITKNYGGKSFSLEAKTTSDGKLTYKSSNKKVATISSKGKVAIKGYGKATFTITTEETDLYEKATKKVTITVIPKKCAVSKVKSKGDGLVSLTWKKNKTVDGYQIQYSTNKNFKKSVKTKKIKNYKTTNTTLKLKKNKTYYFRIRSYKKVGKNTYYGSYSKVKKVKVK